MLEFLPNDRPAAKYGALYLAATGLYSFVPIWLTWVFLSCLLWLGFMALILEIGRQ